MDITAQILPTDFLEGTIADRFFQTAEELDYRYPNDPGQAEWCLVNIYQVVLIRIIGLTIPVLYPPELTDNPLM